MCTCTYEYAINTYKYAICTYEYAINIGYISLLNFDYCFSRQLGDSLLVWRIAINMTNHWQLIDLVFYDLSFQEEVSGNELEKDPWEWYKQFYFFSLSYTTVLKFRTFSHLEDHTTQSIYNINFLFSVSIVVRFFIFVCSCV